MFRGLTVPLLLIAALALCGLIADEIYSGWLLTEVILGAAAGSVLISLILSRAPAWLIAPVSTLGLGGYLVFALQYTARAGQIEGSLQTIAWESLRDGVPRLIAAMVPIEAQPDTVAVPIVATWLAGLAAAELTGRFRRTLVGLVPVVVLFIGAVWLVGPLRTVTLWPSLAFSAILAILLAVTGRVRTPLEGVDRKTRNALRLRTTIAGASALTLILALVIASTPSLTHQIKQKPADPRSLIEPPQLDALDENPLIRLSGWALQPEEKLMEATLDHDTLLRLAVMSDYDGVTWRVGATYRPAGRTLPELPTDVPRQKVAQEITIAGLSGKLLPAVATPRQIDGIRVSFDVASGTTIRPEGLVEGMSYHVVSQLDTPDVNLLPGADVPKGDAMARYLSVAPGVPDDIESLAKRIGSENGAPYQRALGIERYLSEHYRLDPQAPSGHAYPNLKFFLFTAPNAGGQKGTSEQFAATYALLARLLNLPSRVVVGFKAKSGTHDVKAGDALAWPEVYFEKLGWVAFNPLPESDQIRPPEEFFQPKPDQPSEPPTPSEAPIPTLEPTTGAPTELGPIPTQAQGPNVALIAGAGGGGLLVFSLACFILIVLIGRSALSRRRLRSGSPRDQIQGAWLEIDDALRLAGHRAPDHLTAAEVADHAAEAAAHVRGRHTVRLAAPAIDDAARSVNDAVFAPDDILAAQAESAKASAERFVSELKARRSWWRRLIWTLHPGPLRWNRRR